MRSIILMKQPGPATELDDAIEEAQRVLREYPLPHVAVIHTGVQSRVAFWLALNDLLKAVDPEAEVKATRSETGEPK